MKNNKSLFTESTSLGSETGKINLECWIEFQTVFNSYSYSRYISKLIKTIKIAFYNFKKINEDDFEYFVDLNIRNSPSKTAFLSIECTFIKQKHKKIKNFQNYLDILKNILNNETQLKVFFNEKKRRT